MDKRYKIIIEGDYYYLVENPDAIVVGSGAKTPESDFFKPGKGKKIATWQNEDATAFGSFRGKFYFSPFGRTHADILYPLSDEPGARKTSGKSRDGWKYPGRLWVNKKIISFWEYPPYSQLKKVLKDIEKAYSREHQGKIDLLSWKIDIPRTEEMESMDGMKSADVFRGPVNWDNEHSDYVWNNTRIYSIKNVLGNKPLKGLGKPWKEKGSNLSVDKGQEHVASPMKKKNLAKMTDKQKKDMWDYFKSKASLAPDEKRMMQMVQRSLKKEGVDIFVSNDHTIYEVYERNTISESPDQIIVNDPQVGKKLLFTFQSGGPAFAFGYYGGELIIGGEGFWHSSTKAGNRRNMKFPGRIWINKKVISFWNYPKLSQLKKVLKDIEHAWNNVEMDNYGETNFPEDNYWKVETRAAIWGKLKFDSSWRLDIPAESGDSYDDFVKGTGGADVAPVDFQSKGYLYSLKTVFSNKPLKGTGSKLRAGEKVSTQDVDHVKPAMLKKGNVAKMSDKQKKDLYNYFKAKGSLSPAEKRMWKVLGKESVEVYVGDKKVIFKEISNSYFTFDEECGILTEAPHIEVSDKVIDFEFEKDKLHGLKNVLKAIMGAEITDKYGNKFKLSSDREVQEFIKKIARNSQIRRSID